MRHKKTGIFSCRGVFTIEYAILLAVVVAALVEMVVIMKRAVSDKFRQSGAAIGAGRQYSVPSWEHIWGK